jgi:predicted phosphoribosyltransferase
VHFRDRHHAGRELGAALGRYRNDPSVIVLGLPRGGVPVAFEVAQALGAPLDVFIVRKLGLPGHEEFAIGAIASNNVRVMNPDVGTFGVPPAAIEAVAAREREELDRREILYRGNRGPLRLDDRTVILVDDGLATGSTMLAAATAVKLQRPRRVVVGVPVAARESVDVLAREVDEIVCLATPEPFRAVGLWYGDFTQTSDDEVRRLLGVAQHGATSRLP